MTAYVANHLKRKGILEKEEQELEHAIRHEFPMTKLVKAANKVRAAKLNVYKSEYARKTSRAPSSYVPDEKAKRWENYLAEEIIEIYREKLRQEKQESPISGENDDSEI